MHSDLADPLGERLQPLPERMAEREREQPLDIGAKRLLPPLVLLDPAGIGLRLLGRLDDVRDQAIAQQWQLLEAQGPGADQRLQQEHLLVAIRRVPAVHFAPQLLGPAGEGDGGLAPLLRQLGERVDAHAGILAALGIVGGGGEQRARPLPGALAVLLME